MMSDNENVSKSYLNEKNLKEIRGMENRVDESILNDLQLKESDPWKRNSFKRRFIKATNPKVLYVHTPFCKSKCKYCVYSSIVPKSNEIMDTFVNEVIPAHIELYRDVFDQVKFDQVYFGGGTPSILSPEQLRKEFSFIPNFDSIPNKCIESSPTTVTSEHIRLYEEKKFSFMSMGVQDLREEVLKKYGRPYVTRERLKELCDEINPTGIFLNLDFICYLDHGDIRDLVDFEKQIRYTLEVLQPTSVTIHQYYQSHFTTEKTKYLVDMLNRILCDHQDYTCVNSTLSMEDNDILQETLHEAEYRLAKKSRKNYSHYMWDKSPTLPIAGYDVLSIGFTSRCATTSTVNKLVYSETNDFLATV